MTIAEEAFNQLLAESCSSPSDEHEGFNEYAFKVEMHCCAVNLKIIAKCIQKEPTFAYEIKSIERV